MNRLKPLVGVVRSCKVASESFDQFNRLAAALAKSQDRRASSRGFVFWLGLVPGLLVNTNVFPWDESRKDCRCGKRGWEIAPTVDETVRTDPGRRGWGYPGQRQQSGRAWSVR